MPLTREQRARFEQIRDEGLKYADYQAATIADATKTGIVPVEVDFRYLVLNAAAAALDRDDREREAKERTFEVRVTLLVACVAAAATVVQAVALVFDLVRH